MDGALAAHRGPAPSLHMNVADALSANLGVGATTTPKAVLATKVVATIGLASEDLETLRAMVAAGMDVARINFSHIRTHDELTRQVGLVRAAAAAEGRQVAILGDLCGPKMRLRHVPDGGVHVEPGSVGFGLFRFFWRRRQVVFTSLATICDLRRYRSGSNHHWHAGGSEDKGR